MSGKIHREEMLGFLEFMDGIIDRMISQFEDGIKIDYEGGIERKGMMEFEYKDYVINKKVMTKLSMYYHFDWKEIEKDFNSYDWFLGENYGDDKIYEIGLGIKTLILKIKSDINRIDN